MVELQQQRAEGKVLVYGAGNVAYSLVPALVGALGAARIEVYSRSEESASALGQANGVAWHSGAWQPREKYEVCVVAVPDAAVRESVKRLEKAGRLVVHTSGSVPLVPLAEGGGGVMYPLQSFNRGECSDMRRVPLYVEGQNEATCQRVRALAMLLSDRVRVLSSEARECLHIGGVVVNNFVYRLLVLVGELVGKSSGIEMRDYEALLRTTIARGLSGDGGIRQTGPAHRGDLATIARHLQWLRQEQPSLLGPYVALTENILQWSKGEDWKRDKEAKTNGSEKFS